ncbi:MAG: hypothetical protein ACI9S8_000519 [Chlamydiales bacterium]|jgi:hypothetical protein
MTSSLSNNLQIQTPFNRSFSEGYLTFKSPPLIDPDLSERTVNIVVKLMAKIRSNSYKSFFNEINSPKFKRIDPDFERLRLDKYFPMPTVTLDEYDQSAQTAMHEIIPGLFLGGEIGAGKRFGRQDDVSKKEQNLKDKGITHVLCCTSQKQLFFPNSFTYEAIELDDVNEASILEHIEKALEFIKSGMNEGGVLIHCSAGASRSASFLIAYLMQTHKLPFEAVYGFVKSKRLCVEPNQGFQRELRQFEESLCLRF